MQFVLVHGSFHGAWCWQHLTPYLERRGHHVIAPNLPGSGEDPSPPENADLESYATRIAGVIDGLAGPVVLVGHSMGGIVSSQVAERRARRLAATVYVNGLLFRAGETLVGFLDEHAHLGVEDLVLKNMQVAEDGLTATFPQEAATEVFYNTSPRELASWAATRLRPQRMQVYRDALALTPDRYGSVRRFYVEGLRDNAVSIAYQRAMTAHALRARVHARLRSFAVPLQARSSRRHSRRGCAERRLTGARGTAGVPLPKSLFAFAAPNPNSAREHRFD